MLPLRAETSIVLIAGVLTVMRRAHSARWCKEKLVGPLREMIGDAEGPGHITAIPSELDSARTSAAKILEAHCRMCGACKLGR